MSSPPLTLEITPSWRRAVRAVVYEALFTVNRGYWLVRLAFALLLVETAHASLGRLFHPVTDLGAIGLTSLFVVIPAIWFSYPVLRGREDDEDNERKNFVKLIQSEVTARLPVAS